MPEESLFKYIDQNNLEKKYLGQQSTKTEKTLKVLSLVSPERFLKDMAYCIL